MSDQGPDIRPLLDQPGGDFFDLRDPADPDRPATPLGDLAREAAERRAAGLPPRDVGQWDDEEVVDGEVVEPGTGLEPVATEAVQRQSVGLADLRASLTYLDDVRADLKLARDVDNLAHGAADVALIIGDLRALERQTKADIAEIMLEDHGTARGNPKRTVEGLGIIDVPGGNERKNWDSERLLRKIMLEAIIDENGEIMPGSPAELTDVLFKALVEVLPITPSLGWRVGSFDKATQQLTGLKGRGVDPDEWCENTPKQRLAAIPKKDAST